MTIEFFPPLLNSSNPWATTKEDLQKLYECQFTGAVSTRTSLLEGFQHDDSIHQYVFFDAASSTTDKSALAKPNSSLNTLGYSPLDLSTYLGFIEAIVNETTTLKKKPFIISVTGSAAEIVKCHQLIVECATRLEHPLLMEINLSCPNIADKPPPAYSGPALAEYLNALQAQEKIDGAHGVPIGIKTPPYTFTDQFTTLVNSLLSTTKNGAPCPVDFITATNTLGSCLVLTKDEKSPALYEPTLSSASGTGLGGMAGSAIHPLSLGNVRTIRSLLDQHATLKRIDIIGVGGVSDEASFHRMCGVGAAAVAVGTAFGQEGVNIFQKIWPPPRYNRSQQATEDK